MAECPFGFPKRLRLLTRRDFNRVFNRPIRSSDGLFTVLASRNDLGVCRLGLAISRKHAPRAVQRNRLKRLIRETFRTRRSELAGLDMVFLGRHGVGMRCNSEVRDSLEQHWRRLATQCRR